MQISLLLLFLAVFHSSVRSEDLKLVITLARHGIREGEINMQTGAKTNQDLTAPGMRQQYLLGEYLAQKYRQNHSNFWDTTYDPYKFYVRASNSDRTLISAQSQLLGIFPFGTGPNITVNDPERIQPPLNLTVDVSKLGQAAVLNNYQPVAIMSTNEELDFLLRSYYSSTCPKLDKLRADRKTDAFYQNIAQQLGPVVAEIRSTMNISSKIKLDTLDDLSNFYDALLAIYYNGRDPGLDLNGELFRKIQYLAEFQYLYVLHGNTTLLQIGLSPIIQEIISNIDGVLSGASQLQGVTFVGHESTLMGMLTALNVSSHQCVIDYFNANKSHDANCFGKPIFSSHFEFEVYTNNSSPYIRTWYNGQELDLCNGTPCSYSRFKSMLNPYVVTKAQYRDMCGNRMLRDNPYEEYNYTSTITDTTNDGKRPVMTYIVINIILALLLVVINRYGKELTLRFLPKTADRNEAIELAET